jgi:hypothetical protein
VANVGLVANCRFQWPNGRYTSNIRVDATVAYSCTGPTPYSTDNAAGPLFNLPDPAKPIRIEPVICLPGTEISIEIESPLGLSQGTFSVMIEFRGRLRRFLRGSKGDPGAGTRTLNLANLKASDFLSASECGYVMPDQPYVELPHSLVYTSPALQTGAVISNERQPIGGLGVFIVTGILVEPPPVSGSGIA